MPSLQKCPECQSSMRVQDEMLGKKIRCPNCKAVFVVPRPAEPELFAELVETERRYSNEPPPPPPPPVPPPPPPPPPRSRRGSRRDDSDDVDELADFNRGIPSSVILAIVAMGLLLCLEIGLGVMAFTQRDMTENQMVARLAQLIVGGIIGGLILWGLIAGHRLAWQWGRILGLLAAIFLLLGALLLLSEAKNAIVPMAAYIGAGLILFMSGCLFIIAIALGTDSARMHFGLRCPECRRFTSAAGDFFFNTAKCKRCDIEW
jgi:predicted Zn finger-like uncharacterized protein